MGLMWVVNDPCGNDNEGISRDIETVRLMGIDADRVISYTFCLGSALAAVGRNPLVHEISCFGTIHGHYTRSESFYSGCFGRNRQCKGRLQWEA